MSGQTLLRSKSANFRFTMPLVRGVDVTVNPFTFFVW